MIKMNSLFYTNVENREGIEPLFEELEKYVEKSINPVYVINKPLEEKEVDYGYEKAVAVLIPRHRIMFVNYGKNQDKFEDFCDDFIEDLGQLSKKYEYKKILGRPRQWKDQFTARYEYCEVRDSSFADFLKGNRLETKEDERKGEFLISLLTGSINDVERTGTEYPETILEKLKRKIILFDGDQTRFIFDEPQKNKIIIQGLAGTGKTELLLHKIKNLYMDDTKKFKIVFTCHNKILAESLKTRIPEFFDFMRVDEQIKWNEKLWVMRGWGAQSDPDSGVYSYICDYYGITFERFSYTSTFEEVCRRALGRLNTLEDFEECFDYILIDESQDFPEAFFDLCEKVTKHCLYIAGDIFQNVFEKENISKVNPDFLLNKCYRTDPKTLMCAHAIGMGLFANEPGRYLRWLDDRAWESCGYDLKKENGYYDLYRRPLRRFEDLGNTGIKSIEVISSDRSQFVVQILEIIENLKKDNQTLERGRKKSCVFRK